MGYNLSGYSFMQQSSGLGLYERPTVTLVSSVDMHLVSSVYIHIYSHHIVVSGPEYLHTCTPTQLSVATVAIAIEYNTQRDL